MASELVPLDPNSCPSCAGSLTVDEAVEGPLFIHGGYGAARATRWRVCTNKLCNYVLLHEISEVKP